MLLRGRTFSVAVMLAGALAAGGCVGGIGESNPGPVGGGGNSGNAGNAGRGGAGAGAGPDGGGSVPVAYLPARVRRLTDAEYDASVQALLGTTQTLSSTFPPDSRQGSFTLNGAQRVDPVLARQLDVAAQALVAEARKNGKLAALAPCANPTAGGEACARTFVQSFGARAYRRALDDAEVSGLLTAYHVAADKTTYDDGVDLIVRALLQSAGFLYVTELGQTPANGTVTLTADELAATLSYVVSASPPDQALLDAAAAGALATADGREQQARRLVATAHGRDRIVRVVREWLGIDAIANIAKDTTVYPGFAAVKSSMEAESVGFITEVLTRSTGTVGELFGADWTIADAPLAAMYGVTSAGSGHTSLTAVGRRGILNQGAFLAIYAHASESAPVLRGVAVMRRIACLALGSPTDLNIVVTPPVPDPGKTTRQRFDIHSTDDRCKSCHNAIDAFGFSFEQFDGMGRFRTTDSGLPVDSVTNVQVGADFDGSYADSNALAAALAASPTVRACMARQLFRASAGRSDSTAAPSEDSFVDGWQRLSPGQQGNIVETLIAFVRSDQFAVRSTP
jgi:hypothetical protein